MSSALLLLIAYINLPIVAAHVLDCGLSNDLLPLSVSLHIFAHGFSFAIVFSPTVAFLSQFW